MTGPELPRAPWAGLHALPCGVDFPAELVRGLIARLGGDGPEALARVTLWLNTSRMMRQVRAEFDRQLPEGGLHILPRMRLIADLGRDPLADLPLPVPPLRRRLELAQLVAAMVESNPDFAAGSGIFPLADSLAGLMEEMQGEGVDLAALERLDVADHAAHWQRALAFIRIVGRWFEGGEAAAAPDAEARQRRLVEALIDHWAKAPPADPVIVAGSTGSRGATALFLQAVARLPRGAVILPGIDPDLPAPIWDSLEDGPFPAEDHPQFRHLALARALDLRPGAIPMWTATPPEAPERAALVSLALRPAPVTDQWLSEGPGLGPIAPAAARMTLIEAPDPRAEALAIALRLRRAAEEGQRAALITPDRMLTRRVAAALDRWDIVPDDSAGQPLILSPPGRFLRHVAAQLGQPVTIESLLVLLKHPLTATGSQDRGPHLRFTRELELRLRARGPAFPTGEALRAWASARGDEGIVPWADWLAHALEGVADHVGKLPLSAWIETHMALAATLAAGPAGSVETSELWRAAGGREARAVMDRLTQEAAHGGAFGPHDYRELLAGQLDKGSVRQGQTPHPLISVRGTLEARTGGAELVILGGLVDGVWPQMPPPDPWLSRRMRADAGLLLPERAVGLSAHDFQQAIGAPEVVLSRALRDAEAETVPSRWLNRLMNLMEGLPEQGGPEALAAMRGRGRALVEIALQLERPATEAPRAARPAPQPPIEARPRELYVTGIRTLIRDPYQIYAKNVLRLRPLPPIGVEPDPRLRGQVLHRIVEDFVGQRPEGETIEAARERLMQVADRVLEAEIPWPSARRFWRARLARVADRFVLAEDRRAGRGTPVVMEETGSVSLKSPAFTLSAKPDRIDQLQDGRVHIYDYKTGQPPTEKQQQLYDKQLLLEACMAERGGFRQMGPVAVEGITYIGLGTGAKLVETLIEDDILGRTWAGLERLVSAYLVAGRGYTARRAMFSDRDISDYDHLSRFGEWDLTQEPRPEKLGDWDETEPNSTEGAA